MSRIKGLVKWYNTRSAYGMARARIAKDEAGKIIETVEADTDIFFHIKDVLNRRQTLSVFFPGDELEFSVTITTKGLRAKDVRLVRRTENYDRLTHVAD